ncbi:MAG: DUF481 domain-containing protein [Verrucomicrobia bacterium]|nr:DUF481 domain-containing protein [Kiritimatiellia bacterium]MCO6400220.1 DUF481 domain-containing protein [Verrucomicrobiota bacterium]
MKRLIIALLAVGAVSVYAQDSRSTAAQISAAPTAADKVPAKATENSIAIGVTMTDGNSDTLLGTASYLHERKGDDYALRLGLDGAYGETDDERTAENVKGVAEYRRLLSERAYLLGNLTALYDDIADVDYRAVLAIGPGYYLLKDDAATLSVDAGPAYIREKVGGETRDEFALRFGERYERKLSETAKVWQALEYLPLAKDFDDYLLNAEVGIEAAVNNSVSLRLVVKNAYDSTPAEDREKSDTTVIGALAYQL